MLKHIHSILQQNKFNTINIFSFDRARCSVIEGNGVFSNFVVVIHDFTFKPSLFDETLIFWPTRGAFHEWSLQG